MNFVEVLRWKGMLQDIMPGTEEQLIKESTTGYAGFDPTSDSLGIGNLVPVMLLKNFQLCGHKPMALVGGATGMIGDPSGKSAERNLLSEEQLQFNIEGQKKQLEKYLDFNAGKISAQIVNNYDWFKNMGFISFLRDVGKHLTVSYMLAKDSVQNRMESGISFTEFSYQLLQGYDYYWMNKTMNCKLQIGGSDQWGNIVTGTELIRRKSGADAFAITCPLVTKADGGKFGKTESGNVWLDPKKTSPYKFYQFWLNASDADAGKYLRIFTLLAKDEVEALETEHAKSPHLFLLQKTLAKEVTTFIHSKDDFDFAVKASDILFGKATADAFTDLTDEQFMQVFEGVPSITISKTLIESGVDAVSLFSEVSGFLPSKSEARRLITGNGARLNKQIIQSADQIIHSDQLINLKYLLLQKGKKEYFLITVQ